MQIETDRLILVPYTADQLLALIEQPDTFAEVSQYPATAGLREFFVSGEVSPEWTARLRSGKMTQPWGPGFAVVDKETQSIVGTTGFKARPMKTGSSRSRMESCHRAKVAVMQPRPRKHSSSLRTKRGECSE